ncbi:MAG: FAD:protein FMN transferase [Muribaculum sp.]|nr:FAD:protein FMN transferase [Muribaculaceae bacterium]MCM1081564.1 FAD:protein FMN transferase [Muribaculum sp.]
MNKIRTLKASLLTLVMTVILGACSTPMPYQHYEGLCWGTTFHMTYGSNVKLDDSIQSVLAQVDNSLSPFNKNSIISKINSCESDSTDYLFRRVFEESVNINKVSGGVFDPTIGSIVDLWGFGPKGEISKVPTQAEIDSLMLGVGISECFIDSNNRIVKKLPITQFNFSAIAKGFGCDEMSRMLERNGVYNYIIEIGGEIVVDGKSPRGSSWRVMIDAPIPGNDTIIHDGMAVVEVDSCAIATSGNYRNYNSLDSINTYGHTMDPRIGQPARSTMLSATIIAPTCMVADALATACMVMSLDSATAMIERIPDVEALFVTQMDDNGKWMVHTTAGFPAVHR